MTTVASDKRFLNTLRNLITRDVFYTGINQMWRVISGPLTLLLIPLYITSEVQGYWFTFISLSALTVFADLGFTNIVMMFSAHEFAHLHFRDKYRLEGDEAYLQRLSSLLMFVLKWTATVVVLVFPIIFAVGYLLFSDKNDGVEWMLPWILFLMGSAISFFAYVILSFIQGCSLVAASQRIMLYNSIMATVVMLSMLLGGRGLYALAFSSIAGAAVLITVIGLKFGGMLMQLLRVHQTTRTAWAGDFLRLLWRYAISWSSGYLIFQIYTPLMFQYHGAVEAGRVGISIAMWSALHNISNTWVISNVPKFNISVAKKQWHDLDTKARSSIIYSVATYLAGVASVTLLVLCLYGRIPHFDRIVGRFLNLIPMAMLASAWFLQIIINGLAVYLRAHKEEPYVIPSVVSGIYIAATTFLCARYLPAEYLFLGFLSSYIWGLPWCAKIFRDKRILWHGV
ncbi:MAG: hypothetical protein JXA20_09945 [Spirochaetes bacterium]|nr:hypothetical protein [Spirochaetota bacterium]